MLHYRVDGGNHTWPGDTNDVLGLETNLDFDATRVILEQFAGHTLAVPEPAAHVLAFVSMFFYALVCRRRRDAGNGRDFSTNGLSRL